MRWYSNDGTGNSSFLDTQYGAVLDGLSAIDQLSHSVLERAIGTYRGMPWETTFGLALLRRAITQFEGVRYLCERSSIQPASLVARSLFETLLATRYFVFGTRRWVYGGSPTTPRGREVRARYYRVEEVRREVYRRQAAIDRRFGGRQLPRSVTAEIAKEISDRIRFLDRNFPTQQKRFGPFRCFPPAKPIQHHDKYPWYVFGFRREHWDQVRTIRGLAKTFGWVRDYEMLYDSYSGFAHVRGLHHDTEVEPASVAVRVTHAPDDFDVIAYFAWNWQLLILSYLARFLDPLSMFSLQALDRQIRPALSALRPRRPLGSA